MKTNVAFVLILLCLLTSDLVYEVAGAPNKTPVELTAAHSITLNGFRKLSVQHTTERQEVNAVPRPTILRPKKFLSQASGLFQPDDPGIDPSGDIANQREINPRTKLKPEANVPQLNTALKAIPRRNKPFKSVSGIHVSSSAGTVQPLTKDTEATKGGGVRASDESIDSALLSSKKHPAAQKTLTEDTGAMRGRLPTHPRKAKTFRNTPKVLSTLDNQPAGSPVKLDSHEFKGARSSRSTIHVRPMPSSTVGVPIGQDAKAPLKLTILPVEQETQVQQDKSYKPETYRKPIPGKRKQRTGRGTTDHDHTKHSLPPKGKPKVYKHGSGTQHRESIKESPKLAMDPEFVLSKGPRWPASNDKPIAVENRKIKHHSRKGKKSYSKATDPADSGAPAIVAGFFGGILVLAFVFVGMYRLWRNCRKRWSRERTDLDLTDVVIDHGDEEVLFERKHNGGNWPGSTSPASTRTPASPPGTPPRTPTPTPMTLSNTCVPAPPYTALTSNNSSCVVNLSCTEALQTTRLQDCIVSMPAMTETSDYPDTCILTIQAETSDSTDSRKSPVTTEPTSDSSCTEHMSTAALGSLMTSTVSVQETSDSPQTCIVSGPTLTETVEFSDTCDLSIPQETSCSSQTCEVQLPIATETSAFANTCILPMRTAFSASQVTCKNPIPRAIASIPVKTIQACKVPVTLETVAFPNSCIVSIPEDTSVSSNTYTEPIPTEVSDSSTSLTKPLSAETKCAPANSTNTYVIQVSQSEIEDDSRVTSEDSTTAGPPVPPSAIPPPSATTELQKVKLRDGMSRIGGTNALENRRYIKYFTTGEYASDFQGDLKQGVARILGDKKKLADYHKGKRRIIKRQTEETRRSLTDSLLKAKSMILDEMVDKSRDWMCTERRRVIKRAIVPIPPLDCAVNTRRHNTLAELIAFSQTVITSSSQEGKAQRNRKETRKVIRVRTSDLVRRSFAAMIEIAVASINPDEKTKNLKKTNERHRMVIASDAISVRLTSSIITDIPFVRNVICNPPQYDHEDVLPSRSCTCSKCVKRFRQSRKLLRADVPPSPTPLFVKLPRNKNKGKPLQRPKKK